MAQALTSPSSSTSSSFALRFPRDSRLLALLRTWRQRATEKAELAKFDARDLQDAGLTETDRAMIMRMPFWRGIPGC